VIVYRKKLIEVALPLDAINAACAAETENPFLRGHPRSLHNWWARLPLVACRGVLFASLVDDPAEPAAPPAYLAALDALPKPEALPLNWDGMTEAEQRRERLFAFIARLVKWEASSDERVIGTARELISLACEGHPPPVLDPFCGGGSIPLEAQRLGLEAHASDLNPVAVLIAKALIEIPPRFAGQPPVNPEDRSKLGSAGAWKGAAGLAADVHYYGRWMRDEAGRRIGHLYPKAKLPDGGEATVIAWLWARTVRCPSPACGAQAPLVSNFFLSTRKDRQAWVELVQEAGGYRFSVRTGTPINAEGIKKGTKSGKAQDFLCALCGTTIPRSYIREEGKDGRLGARLMALVAAGQRERLYLPPTEEAERVAYSAAENPCVQEARDTFLAGSTPTRAMITGGVCSAYGLTTWGHLFTDRQLVALTTFSDEVGEARERVRRDAAAAGLADDGVPLRDGGTGATAYGDAVAVYLACMLSRLTDYHSSICTWNPTNENVRNVFVRQAIPMSWDFAEANPIESKLDVSAAARWVLDALRLLPSNGFVQAVEIQQKDAKELSNEKNLRFLTSTDPPYYDNIGYAIVADFFYAWLRKAAGNVYPSIFGTLITPKSDELIAAAYRFSGSKEEATRHFRGGFEKALLNIRAASCTSYPLSVYYAYKQAEGDDESIQRSTGWDTMLTALVDAGFTVLGSWPLRTTKKARAVARDTNALASAIVLVCRARPHDAPTASRADFLEHLASAMRQALPVLASGQVAPVDFAQAAIGPGMAAYSRYAAVVRQDGRRVSVREALVDINNAIASYRTERVSSFDGETRFCIDWYSQYGWTDATYGDADTLARAYNVGPEAMERDGLLDAARGRVRLEPLTSYPVGIAGLAQRDFGGSAWEACLRLAQTLGQDGERGTAALVRELGEGAAARARELAVWLYTIADQKKRTDDAFAFNALDASWPAIQEQVAKQGEGEQSRLV
jgi:putative DNA methylase